MMKILLLLIGCASVVLNSADIYVDPPESGFANARINQAIAQAEPGDHIVLRAGEYRVDKAVRFQRAGEKNKPIVFRADQGAVVSLLGSVRLAGWERHEGKVWRIAKPRRMPQGLYQNGARLTHPRPHWGKRVNPDLGELKAPGTWTQDKQYVYLWPRGGSTPDDYRIEASQNYIMVVDKPWTEVRNINFFYGQNVNVKIEADHCLVAECEIAHCSNSVDNSYNAYLSGCSFSKYKNCIIHDSYYWGDHGSNSHVFSCINAGDKGSNYVEGCVIFNGGLGVGTKGAVRELVVTNCKIYDVIHGVTVSGERVNGPGAGKKDRGHYRIFGNYFYQCENGVKKYARSTQGTWVWGNTFNSCVNAVYLKSRDNIPEGFKVFNNLMMNGRVGISLIAGRSGENKLDDFVARGLETKSNLFFNCKHHWLHPLSWSKQLSLRVGADALQDYPALAQQCLELDPQSSYDGYVEASSPCLGKGVAMVLPGYLEQGGARDIGRGLAPNERTGLQLSIAGSDQIVNEGQAIQLKAALVNHGKTAHVFKSETDAIVSFYFRYRHGHADKQEVYRVRVPLGVKEIKAGAQIVLSDADAWKNPLNGSLGDAFHIRRDTEDWAHGCRLSADIQFVEATKASNIALQEIRPLLWSEEVLKLAYAKSQ